MFIWLYIILSIAVAGFALFSGEHQWARYATVACFGGLFTMVALMFSYPAAERPKFTEQVGTGFANVLKFQTPEGGFYYKFRYEGRDRVTRDVEYND